MFSLKRDMISAAATAAAVKAKTPEAEKAGGDGDSAMGDGGLEGIASFNSRIKALQTEIKALKGLDPCIRERLCAHDGGHAAILQRMEADLAKAHAERRGGRPLRDQMESAEAHMRKTCKAHEAAVGQLQALQLQQAQLATKVQQQLDFFEQQQHLSRSRVTRCLTCKQPTPHNPEFASNRENCKAMAWPMRCA